MLTESERVEVNNPVQLLRLTCNNLLTSDNLPLRCNVFEIFRNLNLPTWITLKIDFLFLWNKCKYNGIRLICLNIRKIKPNHFFWLEFFINNWLITINLSVNKTCFQSCSTHNVIILCQFIQNWKPNNKFNDKDKHIYYNQVN